MKDQPVLRSGDPWDGDIWKQKRKESFIDVELHATQI